MLFAHGTCKPGVHSLSAERPFAGRTLTDLRGTTNPVAAANLTYLGDEVLTMFRDMKFDIFPYI